MGKLIGTFIRQNREKKGISQGALAQQLQLKTAQSISNIERGVSPLPKSKMKKLSKVLSLKKDDFYQVLMLEIHERYSKALGVESQDQTKLEKNVMKILKN
jgi:transcriptional regulator with XRE-family HTH domain